MAIISGGSRKSIKTISLFGVSYIMKGSWHCWCLPQISSKYSKGPPQNFIRKPIIFDRYANYWFLTDTDERWGKGVVYCFILSWLFKTNLLRFFGRPPIFQVLERNYCNRYWLFFISFQVESYPCVYRLNCFLAGSPKKGSRNQGFHFQLKLVFENKRYSLRKGVLVWGKIVRDKK